MIGNTVMIRPIKGLSAEVGTTDDRGEPVVVQQPYVLEDLCIGCGICEYQCPLAGQAAIRVQVPSEAVIVG